MRWIVFGLGAIGGVLAAALGSAGHSVAGVARGAQLDAIRDGGLRLRDPSGDRVVRFDVAEDPADLGITKDDRILLCVKGQDTTGALEQLRRAGVREQPIFCFQNGVANEEMVLRRFANVHGVTVMLPATYLTAGEVICHSAPRLGILDIGRAPSGSDDADSELVEALESSGFAAAVSNTVMDGKYGKLLLNLGNAVQAAFGPENAGDVTDALRSEGEDVLRAAGIAWRNVMEDPRRAKLMQMREIPGVDRVGGSSLQSLLRGTGSIETDWLNGEIVLLGRLHGIPTPANAAMCDLTARMLYDGTPPGSVDPEATRRIIGLA